MITQHSKPWPLLIAAVVALLIAATFVTNYFRLRAIDPRVTVEFGEGASVKQTSYRQTVIATTIDGEAARTAERSDGPGAFGKPLRRERADQRTRASRHS